MQKWSELLNLLRLLKKPNLSFSGFPSIVTDSILDISMKKIDKNWKIDITSSKPVFLYFRRNIIYDEHHLLWKWFISRVRTSHRCKFGKNKKRNRMEIKPVMAPAGPWRSINKSCFCCLNSFHTLLFSRTSFIWNETKLYYDVSF